MATTATAAAYEELESRWAELVDIRNAQSILGWDQEVMMPPGGAPARAQSLAALAGIAHERRTDGALVKLVERLHRKKKNLPRQQRRAVELAHDAVKKATRIPGELARELALQESRGLESWRKARASSKFSLFADDLARMVDLKRDAARRVSSESRRKRAGSGGGKLYDALLDDFEPGATMAEIDPVLESLRDVTVKLVRRVRESGTKIDMRPLVGKFDVEAQRTVSRQVALAMGIDLDRGRIDLSTHPFCGGIGPGDVRMTSRYDPRDMRGGLFGGIHEAGHGLYEQGLSAKRARTPLGGAISMAIHESQSRLWENNVGRSRPFWKHWLPKLKRAHGKALAGVKLDDMYRAANRVTPSMIRVEADEVTYNLHIVLRYEIERDLIEGRLEARELPERWNDAMKTYLGVTPKNDAEGVLQDIHWAMGLFGYFPTYSLGNLYAAQWMETARKEIRGLDKKIEKGELAPLRAWLLEKIHRHDRVYTAAQMAKRVTGAPLSVDPFRRYVGKKVREIYG